MASLSTAYISVGANRSSSSSCTLSPSSGVLAYGAGSSVALWDSDDPGRGVYTTLLGHKGQVTTVKRARSEDGQSVLVSGDSFGEIRVWQQGPGKQFKCSHNFVAHKGASVSAIGIVPVEGAAAIDILTGGSEGLVKRWRLSDKVEELEQLDLKGRLPLDMELAVLPGSSVPVLVVGCTDRKVQLWTLVSGSFRFMLSLEGHEDWVRCVSITLYPSAHGGAPDLLLATGAQDNYIRLWRISALIQSTPDEDLDILEEFERRIGGEDGAVQISTKAHVIAVEEKGSTLRYDVTLEALLVGHESGLTNVHWSPATAESSPVLLSSASDNSLVIWAPTSGSSGARDGIWVPSHRFGAFGGRGLSFFGAVWGPEGNTVFATGWTGGVERWVRDGEGWEPAPGVTGHFGAVQSVAWDPAGDYLMSTSSDQTSRIHAACLPTSSTLEAPVWAEIARPQIHGYDLVDAAFLSAYSFASASEEKVMRVFTATAGFAESLRGLGVCEAANSSDLPKGATVPPLGLSNRALGKPTTEPEVKNNNTARDSVSRALTDLPTEEELGTSTLWPEVEKIYGHGYELATLATSHAGDMVATASRATSAEHAVVRLVNASTWASIGEPLAGHSLTVTRIAFSPDDTLLLTVSRDRSWCLYARGNDGTYAAQANQERAHARMILDAAWSSSGTMFATVSRDKTVKLWSKNTDNVWASTSTLTMSEAVTSVALREYGNGDLLAVGTEAGNIEVFEVRDGAATAITAVPAAEAHAAAVNRLAWRTTASPYQLASAGEDRAVRIYDVQL